MNDLEANQSDDELRCRVFFRIDGQISLLMCSAVIVARWTKNAAYGRQPSTKRLSDLLVSDPWTGRIRYAVVAGMLSAWKSSWDFCRPINWRIDWSMAGMRPFVVFAALFYSRSLSISDNRVDFCACVRRRRWRHLSSDDDMRIYSPMSDRYFE